MLALAVDRLSGICWDAGESPLESLSLLTNSALFCFLEGQDVH